MGGLRETVRATKAEGRQVNLLRDSSRALDVGNLRRLSVPGPGRTLSAVAEMRGRAIRDAVRILDSELTSANITAEFEKAFGPKYQVPGLPNTQESIGLRAAWALVNMWLLARRSTVFPGDGGLDVAEKWFQEPFHGRWSLSQSLSKRASREAVHRLSQVSCDEHLTDLLPYLLDPHGPGTRLSVMRDASTSVARRAKRTNGVFYTPADIAEYMVSVVQSTGTKEARWLDPACGTGVFLVAALRGAVEDSSQNHDALAYAVTNLYGFDISALAIESCTFTLLHECIDSVQRKALAPWSVWHALRLNLATVDALLVGKWRGGPNTRQSAATRQCVRSELLEAKDPDTIEPCTAEGDGSGNGQAPSGWLMTADFGVPLCRIFPEAEEGFENLVGNPPYANLGQRDDWDWLAREYECLSGRVVRQNTFPMFVEMMWRLTRPGRSSASLVLPLSISYHTGRQYERCRRAMESNGGRWRAAFFDREPHALFGEDVKTRNAILFRDETGEAPHRGMPCKFETGPLRKWTSRTRSRLFDSVSFTALEQPDIADGIPKLNGPNEAHMFAVLNRVRGRLGDDWKNACTITLDEACGNESKASVLIAGTAYNFLNVFRTVQRDSAWEHPFSESNVRVLEFADETAARVAFAILSSRLVYWLWYVTGDGFHVSRRFLERLPVSVCSLHNGKADQLAGLGDKLWSAVQGDRVVSLNRGKITVAYRPIRFDDMRAAIDTILVEAAGLNTRFVGELGLLVRRNVVVDEDDRRRRRLFSQENTEVARCP